MSPTKHCILCVEDDDATCALFAVLFAHMGHKATTVTSPRAALTLLNRQTFHLYILARRCPHGSGIELCRVLVQRTPTVPIVFYSGATHDAVQEAGVCAGAAAYVPKPHLDELIKTVQRLLDSQG